MGNSKDAASATIVLRCQSKFYCLRLIKNSRWRRALEECSELSYLNIGNDELIYVEASHDSPLWDRMCLVYYACAVSNLV